MFRNYLLTTLRNFRKNKSYIIINAFGLGISLACCISAYILLAFNIEFDSTFSDEKLKNTYRVHTHLAQPDGSNGLQVMAPLNMAPSMANDLASVKRFTRYNGIGGYVRFGDKSFSEYVAVADSTFFDMFEYKLAKGSLESFKNLNTVILSDEAAKKYFVDENPIGQVLLFHFPNQKRIQAVVGGVFVKPPVNSTLVFDLMIRHEHFVDVYNLSTAEWGDWRDPATFVEVQEGQDMGTFSKLLDPYVKLRNEIRTDTKVVTYTVEPFKKPVNQDDVLWSNINLRISVIPLVIFSVMAGLILLIACFNLTNTSFALTARRLKEVGIRKVIGASRKQIVTQFLMEMVVTIVLSLIVGLIMAKFIADEFTNMWNLPYGLEDMSGLNLFVALVMLLFIAALMAGLYPALANSKFKPVDLLKRNVKLKGANWFTKSLVTMQFAISVFVLINGIIFIQNTKFQETIDYGYGMKEVLTVNIQSEQDYQVIKNRVVSNPDVLETSITQHPLGWSYPFPVKVDTTEYQVQHIQVGENFFEVMGLKLVEGRFLDMRNVTDRTHAIIVNEAFVKHTKLTDPLNQVVDVRGEKLRIVGVVENHVDNLFRSKEPEPFTFYGARPNEFQMMLVKGESSKLAGIKTYMEEVWKEEFPDRPFEGRFQEDQIMEGIRQVNGNLKKIFLFLTVLGGLLSISGIYALAALNVEKRTKEIGIRKVLGGSVSYLVRLLSREFAIILTIAAIIGSLGGYFISTMMLDNIYAYHIAVGAFPLIFSSLVIFIMGIVTTGWIIAKAALANPVSSLRSE